MHTRDFLGTFALVAATAATLAACGGGGGGEDSTPVPTPPAEPLVLEALPLLAGNWQSIGSGSNWYGGPSEWQSTLEVSVPDIQNLPAGTRFARAEVVASSIDGVAFQNTNNGTAESIDVSCDGADEDGKVLLALENFANKGGYTVLKITTDAADFDIGNGISEESAVLLAQLSASLAGTHTCSLRNTCATQVNSAALPARITIPAGGTLKIEQRDTPSAQQLGVGTLCNPSESESCKYSVQSSVGMTLEYEDGALVLKVPADTRPGDYPAAMTLDGNDDNEDGKFTLIVTPTIHVTR